MNYGTWKFLVDSTTQITRVLLLVVSTPTLIICNSVTSHSFKRKCHCGFNIKNIKLVISQTNTPEHSINSRSLLKRFKGVASNIPLLKLWFNWFLVHVVSSSLLSRHLWKESSAIEFCINLEVKKVKITKRLISEVNS